MYFAANEQISRAPISGGIKITANQFAQAQAAMAAGKMVMIVDGHLVIKERPPLPPAPEPTPEEMLEAARAAMQLSFAQLLIGLVTEGWITEPEGDAWLAGQLPDAVIALISTLPVEQRFAAKARAARPSIILRADSLVNALAGAQGKSPEELDAFFIKYTAV